MSLLMDALKRAEEAKRQQASAGSPAAESSGGIALEPRPGDTTPSLSPLPDLQSHQDAVDKDLREVAGGANFTHASPPGTAKGSRQVAAQNVFSAKLAPEDDTHRRKKSIIIMVGVGSLAGAAVGGYFWYQLNTMPATSGLARSGGFAVTGKPAPIRPVNLAATAPAPAPAPLAEAAAKPVVAPEKPAAPTLPTVSRKPASAQSGQSRQSTMGTATREGALSVNIGVSSEPTILRAYNALQAGKVDEAKSLYMLVLTSDPNNIDGMLGLAHIVSREGQIERADRLYSRVLQLDPRNPTAHSALASLRTGGDPGATESSLKSLIAQQSADEGGRAALHFSLANLYAGQKRWSEAQQSYFNAHAGDGENPDYAYNLAVSLEQMGQRANARKFYESALRLADRRQSAFDRKQAEARLAELSR